LFQEIFVESLQCYLVEWGLIYVGVEGLEGVWIVLVDYFVGFISGQESSQSLTYYWYWYEKYNFVYWKF
jgi:hypothetical protein